MIRIFAAGDVVNYEHPTGEICSPELEDIIKDCDYAVCNFEAPIHSNGKAQPKLGPHHIQRKETISGLKKQGFDLLLLANNHILDYGKCGLEATIKQIESHQLEYAGADLTFNKAYRPLIKKIKGYTVGVINAAEAQFGVLDYFRTENQAGYAWINHCNIDEIVLSLKKQCDFVIVFSHAGLENYSIPQKEWRMRYKHLCRLGADAVIGSHPHVPQGYEYYHDSLIVYSIGNFYFDSEKRKHKEEHTYSVILKFAKGRPVELEPIFHHKENGVVQLSPVDKQIDINSLNENLDENIYRELHDHMSLAAYEIIRRNLTYSLVPIPYDGTLKGTLAKIYRYFICRKKVDKTLQLLHHLRNEAYYYAARHALELKAQQKNQNYE